MIIALLISYSIIRNTWRAIQRLWNLESSSRHESLETVWFHRENWQRQSRAFKQSPKVLVIASKFVWLELYLARGLWSSWWLSFSHMPLYVCSSCWDQISVRVIMCLEVNSEWCCHLREVCFNLNMNGCVYVCVHARMHVRYSHTFREWGVGVCRGHKGIKESRVWEKMAHSLFTIGKVYTSERWSSLFSNPFYIKNL